ncbi:MAG: hypothetical protein JWP35_4402 [Caulobacter sp.]|nr:hypothetical protein [Caulobacter sp.]
MGFTLEQIRLLFETYEREGHDAQAARALLLFRERLAALELKRDQIDDALEVLRAASDRLAAKLEATSA